MDNILLLSPLIIFLALLIDLLIGDPRWLPHPVVAIGKMISWLEKKLYPQREQKQQALYWRGALLSLLVVTTTTLLTVALLYSTISLTEWLYTIVAAILLGIALAARTLAGAALEIKELLEQGNLVQARLKLSYIVGRDTENLDESEIVRATVETVAENTVDGITSPLFYAFLFGLPGAYAYKAINTLDSMIGYRNERYLWFGRFAAKFDDLANYVPARLTGFSMILGATILGHPWKAMMKTWRHDASAHPSPNSGISESVMAGALGIQLGGLNYYGGHPSMRATMGEAHQPLRAHHIGQAVKIMTVTTIIFSFFGMCILYGIGKWFL
ncbi:cobalamin biosynthesis protein CobD [Heliorestis acidaminivorans]|uniref:Cobalamin biosynthesis protein CobD n=1 Tax=Heliorestis acidaminivorans TaxID=553427 RepID=A0A6I0EWM0_9FIRM|nr:adenosylcobinamide-phosphate synthase CbiB [Heliorestis acidaminivorans]KAB2954189.1 cobalamin biosynthesis protein CobD [Heliorestis acidaminivorans]